jgi:hypothetical protein
MTTLTAILVAILVALAAFAAWTATAALHALFQFLFRHLAVAILVELLHALPCFGWHFVLSDEAVAILVERLKVWALAAFAARTTWSLSRTAWSTLTALATRILRRRGLVSRWRDGNNRACK